jgi:hypothetical protein
VNWVTFYQVGTAVALAGLWLFWAVQRTRRLGIGSLWVAALVTPDAVIAWYFLEFCALVYGCIRLSGAGC